MSCLWFFVDNIWFFIGIFIIGEIFGYFVGNVNFRLIVFIKYMYIIEKILKKNVWIKRMVIILIFKYMYCNIFYRLFEYFVVLL